MSISSPACPICAGQLAHRVVGELDTWECAAGHGLAITTSEAAHRVQDDEMALIMGHASDPSMWVASSRRCPTCEAAMRTVTVGVDRDEILEGQPGDGPDEFTEKVEVCRTCLFVWFDAGELDQMPLDLPNPQFVATPEQAKVLASIKADAGQVIDESFAEADRRDVSERLYRRILRTRLFGRRPAG